MDVRIGDYNFYGLEHRNTRVKIEVHLNGKWMCYCLSYTGIWPYKFKQNDPLMFKWNDVKNVPKFLYHVIITLLFQKEIKN
jgi:hypothetical protein